MKVFIKVFLGFILAFLLLTAPKIGGWVANLFDYQKIDPDGAFMWISIHHIVQTIVIIIIMFLLIKLTHVKFHLGFGNKEKGISYLKKFMMIFTVYTIIGYAITILSGAFEPFQYPLNARNIFGYLGFQLLLSGPSEEFIFRAFSIGVFAFFISNKRLNKYMSYAVLFSAILFGIAHISFSLSPFTITYSLFQVGYAIVLGYFYGDCYEKSESVIYPMIMHSFTNVMMVGLTILLSLIL
ncbi:MAG: hypothetical protein CVV61_04260 [Tenericutes bacterium HGW-Tenericutes-6]|nr:MAG: hypothetical protein CVV61_04260 [Tenericutes bacterium HGW-Tenericutes-6]